MNKATDSVLNRDEVTAIIESAFCDLAPSSSRFWLRLPRQVETRIIKRAGFDPVALSKMSITMFARFDLTPAVERILGCLYLPRPEHYYLEMLEDGRLFRKYQQIIGSRHCGDVDAEMLELLVERLAAKLGPRVTAEVARKGHPVSKVNSTRSIEEELALLTATDNRINLPTEHLVHYPHIKQLLQNAGGVYNAKGHSVFEGGNDARNVLARLAGGEKINIQQQTQSFYTPAELAKDVCLQHLPDPSVDLASKPLSVRPVIRNIRSVAEAPGTQLGLLAA